MSEFMARAAQEHLQRIVNEIQATGLSVSISNGLVAIAAVAPGGARPAVAAALSPNGNGSHAAAVATSTPAAVVNGLCVEHNEKLNSNGKCKKCQARIYQKRWAEKNPSKK